MRYLFTTPQTTLSCEATPVGVAYVAAALRHTGRNISIFNFTPQNTIDQLLNVIKKENIEVLCIGALSAQYPALKTMISAVRTSSPGVKILVGGGIITAEPEFIVSHIDIDFGCIGYGEELICEFAECFEKKGDFSNVKGLIYRNHDGSFSINPMRPEPKSIDEIPYPAFDLLPYGGVLDIVGSRSCPFKCTFCFHPSGYKYKQRSLDSIFDEIKYWKQKLDVHTVAFADELFGRDKERVKEFCERFKKLNLNLSLQLRVDIVTEELIKILKDANCKTISLGIESVNQHVLDSMQKQITVEQIENALRLTRKYKIAIVGNLIFGDKAETFETASESLAWWYRNSHYGLNLDFIRAHPGSALYKYGVEIGRIDRLEFLEKGCPALNLSAMSDKEFSKVMRKTEIMSKLIGEPITNPRVEVYENGSILFYGDCPNCDKNNFVRAEEFFKSVTFMNQNLCVNCGSKIRITNHFLDFVDGYDYFERFDYTNKKIAVWGATLKAMFRMATNIKFREAVAVIVDTNYKDCEYKSFMGVAVQSPEVLTETEFEVLYIGARYSEARQSILEAAEGIMGDGKEIMLLS